MKILALLAILSASACSPAAAPPEYFLMQLIDAHCIQTSEATAEACYALIRLRPVEK